jgi:hypothetical protein
MSQEPPSDQEGTAPQATESGFDVITAFLDLFVDAFSAISSVHRKVRPSFITQSLKRLLLFLTFLVLCFRTRSMIATSLHVAICVLQITTRISVNRRHGNDRWL